MSIRQPAGSASNGASSGSSALAFLHKLKSASAASAPQETFEDDEQGYRTVVVERGFLNEPLDCLGLQLSADAQVQSVRRDGPCRRIPEKYFIVTVNEHYVDSSDTFHSLAQKDLRLVVKIYNAAAMEELLARILMDDSVLDDVRRLYESTPRYAFLGSEHPLFMRWSIRSAKNLEAKRFLQSMQEKAEEQAAQESLRAMQETMQRAEEEERRRAEEERVQAEKLGQEEERRRQEALAASNPQHATIQETLFSSDSANTTSLFDESAQQNESEDAAMKDPTADELLAIVAGSHRSPVSATAAPNADELLSIVMGSAFPAGSAPPPSGPVKCMLRYKQPYRLSDGTEVEVVVKERYGARPAPPAEDPPAKAPSAAVSVQGAAHPTPSSSKCSYCQSTEHAVYTCTLRRAERSKMWIEQEAERLKSMRDKEKCRDFLRGRCDRKPCPFNHEKLASKRNDSPYQARKRSRSRSTPRPRSRSPAQRKDDRRRDERRDDYRHEKRDERRDDHRHEKRDERRDDTRHESDRRRNDGTERRDRSRDETRRRDDSAERRNDARRRNDPPPHARRRSISPRDARRVVAKSANASSAEWSRAQRRL